MFEWGDLIFPLRNWLVICQFIGNLFSVNQIVDINSQLELNISAFLPLFSLIGSRESIPSPTTRACNDFVVTYIHNKGNYVAALAAEKKKLMTNLAWETIELLQHQEFVARRFRLDTLHAPPLLAETAKVIAMRYSCLNLWAKTKLYVD